MTDITFAGTLWPQAGNVRGRPRLVVLWPE